WRQDAGSTLESFFLVRSALDGYPLNRGERTNFIRTPTVLNPKNSQPMKTNASEPRKTSASMNHRDRGRDAGCPAPPAQIPAGGFPAPGSSERLTHARAAR